MEFLGEKTNGKKFYYMMVKVNSCLGYRLMRGFSLMGVVVVVGLGTKELT